MKNPLRPFLYVEDNFLRIKSYTSTYNADPTLQFTVDNDKVKINKSYGATVVTPLVLAIIAIIMLVALVYDIRTGISPLSFINGFTAIILCLIVFICLGVRPIAEIIGQKTYDNLINNNEEWLEKHFRVIWSTIDDGYTILTSEEAEKLEINDLR